MRIGTLLQNVVHSAGLEVSSAAVCFPWLSGFLRVSDHSRLSRTPQIHLVQTSAQTEPPRAVA